MEIKRQITLTLAGVEIENLVTLLKHCYDSNPKSKALQSACDELLKLINPSKKA